MHMYIYMCVFVYIYICVNTQYGKFLNQVLYLCQQVAHPALFQHKDKKDENIH